MALIARRSLRPWLGLVILLLPALLISMDISILFVAGPSISQDLAPSTTQWLWMMDIYSFVMAGLLITMGSIGDRIGRRRLLLLGSIAFGIGSAGVAVAPSPEWFVAARALLGIGAATLAPSTLALIRSSFDDEHQRRIAVGAWTVAFTGGAIAGPIMGGLLLEHFWWGAVFLINTPVMGLLLVTTPLLIDESRTPQPGAFDLAGMALSLTGVLALVYAGKRVAESGPDHIGLLVLLLGFVLLAGFRVRQRRTPHPLIDFNLFRIPSFRTAIAANLLISIVMAGLGLLAFTFLQSVHAMTPLQAALVAMPVFIGSLVGAIGASVFARIFRPRALMAAGMVVAAAGMAAIGLLSTGAHVATFITGYTVLTLGAGMVSTLASSQVLEAPAPQHTASAASISETGITLGDALGIALFGMASSTVYRSMLTEPDLPTEARETITGALAQAEELPAEPADALIETATQAFTTGLTVVTLAAAIVLLISAIAIGLPPRRQTSPPPPEPCVRSPM